MCVWGGGGVGGGGGGPPCKVHPFFERICSSGALTN